MHRSLNQFHTFEFSSFFTKYKSVSEFLYFAAFYNTKSIRTQCSLVILFEVVASRTALNSQLLHLIVIKQRSGGGGERRMISPLVGAEEQLRVLFDVPLGIGDSVSHTVRTHQISTEYKTISLDFK